MAKKGVDRSGASLEDVLAQIRKEFGEGAIMRMGDAHLSWKSSISRPVHSVWIRLWDWWPATRPYRRDIWAGIIRQDHPDAACDRQCPEGGWGGRLCRCRACA
jgi:hypothetical protein